MSQQIIDLGNGPDSQTGDNLYTAFVKVNDNFTELYGVFDGNGITTINANAIISNNIWNSGNVRTNDVFAYGNVETVGYVITAGAFYPNGVAIGSAVSSATNVIPMANGIYDLGSTDYNFNNVYLSNSVVISGANIAVRSGLLLINGVAVGNYSNANVQSYLISYTGNTGAVLTTSDQPYITSTGILTNLQANNASINGNVLISGNLNVDGNITYFNIRDLSVVDPIITLNTGPNGSPLIVDNGFDSGVRTFYYDGQNKSAFFGRIDNTGYFEYYSNVVSEVGNIVSGTYGTIKTGNLILVNDASISGNTSANYFIGNGRQLTGINSIIQGLSSVEVTSSGNITVNAASTSILVVFSANGVIVNGYFDVNCTISATVFQGNFSGNFIAPGADTQIVFNNTGQLDASPAFTFNGASNTVTISNNLEVTEYANLANIYVFNNTISAKNLDDNIILQPNNVANVYIGNVGQFNSLVVSGNIYTPSNVVVNGFKVIDNTGNIVTSQLENSGVIVGVYGNASAVPIITVDAKGRITDINTTAVAGVSNVVYDNIDSNLSIFTSAGTVFSVNLGVGINNGPLFSNLTVINSVVANDITANSNISVNNNLSVAKSVSASTATFTGNINASVLNGNVNGATGVFGSSIVTSVLNANGTATVNSLVSNGSVSGTIGTFTTNVITTALDTGTLNANGTATVNSLISNGAVSGTTGTFTTSTITSQLYSGNINSNGTATVNQLTSNSAVSGTIFTGTDATFTTKLTTSDLVTGAINANGSVTVNQLTSNGAISGTTGTFNSGVITSTLNANGTATVNSLISNGAVSGTTGTFTTSTTTSQLYSGNINSNGIATVNQLISNGSISGTTGTFTTSTTTSQLYSGNINSNGTVTVNQLSSNGSISGTTGIFTGNVTTDTLLGNVSGNTGSFVGNLSANNLVLTNNLTAATIFAASVGNVGTLLTGTLTTSAQPNLTSVSNTLTIGEFNLSSNTISSTNDTITIEPANVGSTGNVVIQGNLRVTGNLTYIDSTIFVVNDKDILLGNNTSNISDLNGAGLLIGNAGGVNLVTLKYSTGLNSWQTNVAFSPVGNALLDLGKTTTYWANAYIDTVNSVNLNGVLQTSSQPNITSVGSLSSLNLLGNLTGTNVLVSSITTSDLVTANALIINTTANIGSTLIVSGNVIAPYFIGNIVGNISGNLTSPGTNAQILFNDNNLIGANSNFTYNKNTSILTVIGNISASALNGNISGTFGTFTGNVSANNITLTNAIQSSTLITTGNATIGNISTSGLVEITNTTNSTSNVTGAMLISGGVGVGKSLYVGNAVGWVYPNAVSAVYQVYNSVTNSLDTIFG